MKVLHKADEKHFIFKWVKVAMVIVCHCNRGSKALCYSSQWFVV